MAAVKKLLSSTLAYILKKRSNGQLDIHRRQWQYKHEAGQPSIKTNNDGRPFHQRSQLIVEKKKKKKTVSET